MTIRGNEVRVNGFVTHIKKKWLVGTAMLKPLNRIVGQLVGDVAFLRHTFSIDVETVVGGLRNLSRRAVSIRPVRSLPPERHPVIKSALGVINIATHVPLADESRFVTGLLKVLWLAPAVMFANIVYAAAIESISTFFPIFGAHLGLPGHVALGMMTLIGVGGMVLSLPLGWLADHVNRMSMLSVCVILTMAGLLAMPYLVTIPYVSGVYVFVLGGVSGMIYTLGVVLIGEQFKGAMLAIATTTFTACWGAGSVLGPLVVGAGMDWIGVEYMGLIIFLVFLPYLPLPLFARLREFQAD